MLVLTRRKGGRVVIADKAGTVIAVVTVADLERSKTRLGFSAGPEIVIHREEIYVQVYGKVPAVDK